VFRAALRSELEARASSLVAFKIRCVYIFNICKASYCWITANRAKFAQIKLESLLDAYAVPDTCIWNAMSDKASC
jgi:hypothetical protein